MDQVTKLLTALGGGISVAAAIGIVTSWNRLKEGLEAEDPRSVNKGAMGLALNGITLLLIGGLTAYAIAQLAGITG